MTRWLWWLLAYASLGIGIVGIVVPGLPTVPFVLLAAFAAARGSQRLHAWLLAHRQFGPMILRLGTRRRGQPARQAPGHRHDGGVRGGDVPDCTAMVDGRHRHRVHGDRRDVAVAAPRAATVSKAAGTLPA
jgi:hypothetical protein